MVGKVVEGHCRSLLCESWSGVMMSARATGSSQVGQSPPGPIRRHQVLQLSQRAHRGSGSRSRRIRARWSSWPGRAGWEQLGCGAMPSGGTRSNTISVARSG